MYVLNDISLSSSQIYVQLLWLEVSLDLVITARLGAWKLAVNTTPELQSLRNMSGIGFKD